MWTEYTVPSRNTRKQSLEDHMTSALLSHSDGTKPKELTYRRPRPRTSRNGQLLATIWRNAGGEDTHTIGNFAAMHDATCFDTKLSTDPEFDDWYLICYQNDNTNFNVTTEDSVQATLVGRLSQSTQNTGARYLRCSHSELPDLSGWLMFQQFETIIIPTAPAWAVLDQIDSGRGISDRELSHCNQLMVTLFRSKSEVEIHLVLIAIYIVITSFRSLYDSELAAAVREIARIKLRGSVHADYDRIAWLSDCEVILMCRPFLKLDHQRKVTFENASLEEFLTRVSIPGLERGHGSITQMCFDQIRRLGSLLILRPWHRFKTWFRSPAKWPLLRYVARYWFYHYRLAAPSQSGLSAELFRMISTALYNRSLHETPTQVQRKVIDVSFNIAEIYDLPVLAHQLRNMGAAELAPLSRDVPHNWGSMRLVFGLRSSVLLDTACQPIVTDVFDVNAVVVFGQDESDTITSRLRRTHLLSDDTTETLSSTSSCSSTSQDLESEDELEDWEDINYRTVDVRASEVSDELFGDWESIKSEQYLST